MYGSVARGDVDDRSDIDLLMVGDVDAYPDPLAGDATVAALVADGHEPSTMRFTWREVEAMAAYGSLFLHHVKLEGRPLVSQPDDPLTTLLEALPPYRRATQEMEAFQVVLDDVQRSILGPHGPAFELGVVATALRHAFILGCYVTGEPDFGRTSPFRRLCPILNRPLRTASDLATLYEFRLYQQGRAPAPFAATTNDVCMWLRIAGGLFANIQERVDVFDRTLSRPA